MLKTVLLIIELIVILLVAIVLFKVYKTVKTNENKTVESISKKLNWYLNFLMILTVVALVLGCATVFLK